MALSFTLGFNLKQPSYSEAGNAFWKKACYKIQEESGIVMTAI